MKSEANFIAIQMFKSLKKYLLFLERILVPFLWKIIFNAFQTAKLPLVSNQDNPHRACRLIARVKYIYIFFMFQIQLDLFCKLWFFWILFHRQCNRCIDLWPSWSFHAYQHHLTKFRWNHCDINCLER